MQQQLFFNTINESGEELNLSRKKCSEQEAVILDFFTRNHKCGFTPFEVMDSVFQNTPITSVRRAMTNLTNKGLLTKSKIQRVGKYGKKNYVWFKKARETL